MASAPVAVQRGTLKRPDEAFKGFFRRVKAGGTPGFPRCKGRRFFDCISVVSGINVRGGNLHVPGLGAQAIRRKGGNPHLGARPVSAVLKRTGGRRRAIVRFAVEEPAGNGCAIGLDRNGGQVADSEGGLHEMPDMDRRLAKMRRKIANRLRNWHHHVSRKLAAKAGTIAIEGPSVRAMTKSAKGTVEEPGANVPQKCGLNRIILTTGWTALEATLDCKVANVIAVPARDTSRTCHECGAVKRRSRRTRDEFICIDCGQAAHADINAAKNILDRAFGAGSGGGEASGMDASARRGALALATSKSRVISANAA